MEFSRRDRYKIESPTTHLDDDTIVDVTISSRKWWSPRWKVVSEDRFTGPEAEVQATYWIVSFLDHVRPDAPTLEERLMPYGEEWQREMEARDDLPF